MIFSSPDLCVCKSTSLVTHPNTIPLHSLMMTSLAHTFSSAHAAGNWVAFVLVFPFDAVCFMNSMCYVPYLANEIS